MASYLSNLNNRVYVGNLFGDVTPAFLFKIFSTYGRVVSVQKKYPSYAFVEFEDQLSAQKAIKICNGVEIFGRKIFVNKVKNGKNLDLEKSVGSDGEIQSRMDVEENDDKLSGMMVLRRKKIKIE